jgi:hypothetical protein
LGLAFGEVQETKIRAHYELLRILLAFSGLLLLRIPLLLDHVLHQWYSFLRSYMYEYDA